MHKFDVACESPLDGRIVLGGLTFINRSEFMQYFSEEFADFACNGFRKNAAGYMTFNVEVRCMPESCGTCG